MTGLVTLLSETKSGNIKKEKKVGLTVPHCIVAHSRLSSLSILQPMNHSKPSEPLLDNIKVTEGHSFIHLIVFHIPIKLETRSKD